MTLRALLVFFVFVFSVASWDAEKKKKELMVPLNELIELVSARLYGILINDSLHIGIKR